VTNPPYQLIIRELEAILPPRVVSRMLKDGLQQLGREPATVTVSDLEQLLEDQVQRQLLGIMPPDKARAAVSGMVDRLRLPVDSTTRTAAVTAVDTAALARLTAALRPFNLYFEWPEVQKLRAQVQLIEAELQAGQPARALLDEARGQLALVQQKHEDQLVIQARDLAELETSFEHIRTLGGPRVRRLENLLKQVRQNQQERNLASAELERARKLAVELRKLLESSVYTTSERLAPAGGNSLPDPEEVAARLRQLDLDSERHRIDQLEKRFENLLRFHPELQQRLDGLRESLSSDLPSVPDLISAPEVTLQEAFVQLRNQLTEEVSRMSTDVAALSTPVGTTKLRQALQVTNGILASTLPDPADISHIRDLYALAREQVSLAGTAQDTADGDDETGFLSDIYMASRQELLTELYQLEREAKALSGADVPGHSELLDSLRHAHALLRDGELPDLVSLREQLESARNVIAERLSAFPARLAQALATFRQVERLNSEDVLAAGRILRHLDDQKDVFERISPQLRISLEQSLQTAEELLVKLQAEFEATRAIADQLVSANILDDLLGIRAPAAAPTALRPALAAEEAATPAAHPALHEFMASLLQEPGVMGAALLADTGDVLAGRFAQPGQMEETDETALREALQQLEAGLAGLAALEAGKQRLLQLEFDSITLIVSWPAGSCRLVLLISSPAAVDPLLHRLQRDQDTLEKLLDSPALT
jgi:hypothetical protein